MMRLDRTHVPAGSFAVFKTQNEALEAFLGSCVGVAIVDKKAGVGGLYHILLPKSDSPSTPFEEEIYASEGMPRFLKVLQETGGNPSAMEATIAGGALMGRVSQLDLHLDLGGRTVEVVHQKLKEAGIPVVHSETGGYFGRKLELNLHTLQCEITAAHPALPAKKTVVHKPTAAELDHAIVHIQPIPQVALKIIRTIQSEEFDLRDIARQIRHDQVISANVIRMCNTAYISPQLEIQSIDHALLILGVKRVVQFVLSSVMSRFFDCSIHGYALSKGGLYHHAVSTAIVAEQISQLTRRAEPDTAYTAGLLHDIGKVLLDQFVASALPLFYAQMISEGEHLLNVERSLLGITHIEAGSRLAELWDFPLWLKDVIAYHDRPELAQHNRDLAHVIYLADLLISRFNAGYDLDVIETSSLPVRLRYLDLDPASLAELIGRIPWKILDTPGYF